MNTRCAHSMHSGFVCDGCVRALEAQLANAIAGRKADAAEYRRRIILEEEEYDALLAKGAQDRAGVATAREERDREIAANDALRAEVARLRAAIEPTAENVLAIIEAVRDVPADHPLAYCSTGYVLAAIRASAGEVSAPGSSLRERVEALIEKWDSAGGISKHCDQMKELRAALGEP